ncbi:MAG TPA: hypothetical protein VH595_21310 [Verrucomicrobiae bacterium]|jgi:hypothetical protein|nr:hypothetical protein [Verrucomicrobiae bacterium]
MPKVLRRNLPPQLYEHLLDRIQQRKITGKEVALLINWLDGHPDVPQGKWFKKFPGLIVCGEGELIKTFLVPGQIPFGQEI